MNKHPTTLTFGFIHEIEALIKVLSQVCVFFVHDYLN